MGALSTPCKREQLLQPFALQNCCHACTVPSTTQQLRGGTFPSTASSEREVGLTSERLHSLSQHHQLIGRGRANLYPPFPNTVSSQGQVGLTSERLHPLSGPAKSLAPWECSILHLPGGGAGPEQRPFWVPPGSRAASRLTVAHCRLPAHHLPAPGRCPPGCGVFGAWKECEDTTTTWAGPGCAHCRADRP